MPLAEIICWPLPSFDLLTQKAKVLTLLLVGAVPNVFVRRWVDPDSNRSERVTGSAAESAAAGIMELCRIGINLMLYWLGKLLYHH